MKKTFQFIVAGIAATLISPSQAQSPCPVAPLKGGACWTTEDVLQSEIDHHAQSAMFRMFARGDGAAADASAMLCAVRNGQLEGIYLPDQGVPALRARDAGSSWWLMIPEGELATCFKEPTSRPPLIAFKKQIKDDRDTVSNALSSAWRSCNLDITGARCYVPTISRPADQESEDTGQLIVEIRDLADNPYVGMATVAVIDINDPENGDYGLQTGRDEVTFFLAAGASYNVAGQGERIACPAGPNQQVRIEKNHTVHVRLKIPACN
jgi:hypothetical protein